jgi:hypothetical protein
MSYYGRSCVCGGLNENCMYCYGTGVSQGKLSSVGPALKRRARRSGGAAKRSRAGLGEWLGIAAPAASGGWGLTRVRDTKKSGKRPKRKRAVPPKSSDAAAGQRVVKHRCPRRASRVTSPRMAAHSRSAQGCTNSRHYIARPVTHRAGPATRKYRKKEIGISTSAPNGGANCIPLSREEETSRERRLDPTKDYAHCYREFGRFGSHPSHDGFDDESGPDQGLHRRASASRASRADCRVL